MSLQHESSASAQSTSQPKTIKGSCHCGFIKYTFSTPETSLPLTGTRCNCTYCTKCSTTNHSILSSTGKTTFTLLSPASKDDPQLGNYAPAVKTAARYFCKTCGVHVWMQGYYMFEGKRVDAFMINLATIDQPQEGVDLSETKVKYWDGLRDNFAEGLREVPWPNGLL